MMAAMTEAFRHSLDGKDRSEITEIAVRLFCAQKELEIQLKEFQNVSSATEYKTGLTEEAREQARRDYLKKVGIPVSFQSESWQGTNETR